MENYDVAALGELLIDFTENGLSGQENPLLEANPGGAPCNVLAMLANLGKRTAFIGKVGEDPFGRLLREALESRGIDASGLVEDPDVHTTLAFVHTLADGDREFSFYRDPGADEMLCSKEVDLEIVRNAKCFHFGTLSSTREPARSATRYALDAAKKSGAMISFDPNLRENLWSDPADARREIGYGMEHCDLLKISDNELEFMTGTTDSDSGVRMLQEKYDLPLVFVTMGRGGSKAYCKDRVVAAPAFLLQNTVETTGAGDAFTACALNYVLDHGMDLAEEQLKELLTFANAGASLVTTRKGAFKAMPSRQEIEALLS